jgi:serine/threonine protein kinase/basic membrane lipoprotein Med (substrate-binding protein (PBP1-ABC) superfamily)
MEDLTGRQLGSYQIISALGEGGMAAVYKAYQPAMERYVALKILPRHFASDPQFIARFQQEAKILAKLQHPHILPVHDFGEAEGYTYIVMPYVETGTLTDVLQGQPLSLSQIRSIISQVGAALDYAHARGLIHRDVKPSNILIDESGNCLLTDFGLAKMVEGSAALTTSGAIMGTPAYMSPEQGLGQKLDGRSDIYSLGVILYEMASGRTPYSAETPMAVVIKHISDPLPSPRTVNPALPEAVERVILKALAKQPQDRYATAGEFVRALQAAIPDTASLPEAALDTLPTPQAELLPPESSALPQPIQITRPKWVIVAGGVVVLVALVGIAVVFGRNLLPTSTATQTTAPTTVLATTAPPVAGALQKVCYVAEHEPVIGSIIEATWNGLQSGAAQYEAEASYVPVGQAGDILPQPEAIDENITAFVSADCDLIVTAGFNSGDATAAAAKANPRQKFQILDVAYDPPIDNVWAHVYAADQGAFLAGYIAASVSKTGKVGTFGAFQFPTIETFMDGFALGVAYYNEKNGTDVQVLGWDVASRTGYFTNDFASKDKGVDMGNQLLTEGADIIFPVAGPAVGIGAAEAVLAHGNAYFIGVDTDWVISYPEYTPIILTSVEKRYGLSAISAIKAVAEGTFEGGTHIGTVANGEIGIAPFYELDSLVPAQVKTDLIQIKADIITGKIETKP